MFSYAQLKAGLKSLPVSADVSADLCHCQLLTVRARQLGFNDYNHFKQVLKKAPRDAFGNISLRLMREICEKRLPEPGSTYYEFMRLPDGVGFYSQWIGWDNKGDEVRVPRPLDGFASVPRLRAEVDHPVYVISNLDELTAWRLVWGKSAYLPEQLAKAYFKTYFEKDHLVDQDPPMRKVNARYRRNDPYKTNIVKG